MTNFKSNNTIPTTVALATVLAAILLPGLSRPSTADALAINPSRFATLAKSLPKLTLRAKPAVDYIQPGACSIVQNYGETGSLGVDFADLVAAYLEPEGTYSSRVLDYYSDYREILADSTGNNTSSSAVPLYSVVCFPLG